MACPKECFLIAGIGGLLPTLAKLATTYTVTPNSPPPGTGIYVGLALFFVIGCVLAYALSETNVRQALLLGISAPAIITNIVAGAPESKVTRWNGEQDIVAMFIPSAKAQDTPKPRSNPASAATSSPAQRQLTVVSNAPQADSWSKERLRVGVEFFAADGRLLRQDYVPASTQSTLGVPAETTRVKLSSGGKTDEADLPNVARSSVSVTLQVSGKNDLLWALGARRRPVVSNLEATFAPN